MRTKANRTLAIDLWPQESMRPYNESASLRPLSFRNLMQVQTNVVKSRLQNVNLMKMEIRRQEIPNYHHQFNYRQVHPTSQAPYSDNNTQSTSAATGEQSELNHWSSGEHSHWTRTRSVQERYLETAEYVDVPNGAQSNQYHQPHVKYANYHQQDQNFNTRTNQSVTDHTHYNSNTYYQHHQNDNKDLWQPAHQSCSEFPCQPQPYVYSYYDYHHQQPAMTLQQHENIQFSHYHRNYYYESHYEQRISYQSTDLDCATNNYNQQPVSVEQRPTTSYNNDLGKNYPVNGSSCINHVHNSTNECPFATNSSSFNGSNNTVSTECGSGSDTCSDQNIQTRPINSGAVVTANIKHESPEQDSVMRLPRTRNKSLHGKNPISKNLIDVPASNSSTSISISQKTNQCGVCGRNYARPSTLKTHLRTHTNERPFKCDICLKTFSQAANLSAHQRVHTGERPFTCPVCDRQFSQSSSVITHLRTHSGERPYRCAICSRTFSDSSTLTKHCRIHSGEKPYHCDHCPLNFSQSGNLSRHLRLHQINSSSVANPSSSIGSSSSNSRNYRS